MERAGRTETVAMTIVAFIGFGEAGHAIATSLKPEGARAHDILLCDGNVEDNGKGTGGSTGDSKTDAARRDAMRRRIEDAGVAALPDMADALHGADIVISVVTADNALAAATAAAGHIGRDALYLDMNSCAPDTKRAAAKRVNDGGGTYVDVAVMAPILTAGHRTAMIASAPDAKAVAARLSDAGLSPVFVGDEIGRASTIKMLRSVMIKGVEALAAECFGAAVKAGVASEVARSLDASRTDQGWMARAAYTMERMTSHGTRRAAEMREAAATLKALGTAPAMTLGTIERQERIGGLGLTLDADAPLETQMAHIEKAMARARTPAN